MIFGGAIADFVILYRFSKDHILYDFLCFLKKVNSLYTFKLIDMVCVNISLAPLYHNLPQYVSVEHYQKHLLASGGLYRLNIAQTSSWDKQTDFFENVCQAYFVDASILATCLV